ncbi:MAG TPA: tRNA lysidine(34) synthetase TilS [Candidatus Baltobacteraceae bacterium]
MRGAHPERAIERRVEVDGIVRAGQRVVVACSGGPDSVALSAVLHALSKPLGLTLTLAYVNHGTRASAWQDECVALAIAARFGLTLRIVALDGVRADEASLREARYAALLSIARAVDAGAVATAHHAQDQSESVLLALFRGAGPTGLAGMPARRPLGEGIDLIRPLLRVASEDLAAYCRFEGLPYAIDPTNDRAADARNAVRAALDALRPAFPGLDVAVARAAEVVAQERAGSARAGLRRQVRDALREQEGLRDVDFDHVEAAVRALENGSSGRFFMKAGTSLVVERGRLVEE